MVKKGGYQGSIISFYDYNNGKFMNHFKTEECIIWPTCLFKEFFWFLQGDYNSGKITLFRYLPDKFQS